MVRLPAPTIPDTGTVQLASLLGLATVLEVIGGASGRSSNRVSRMRTRPGGPGLPPLAIAIAASALLAPGCEGAQSALVPAGRDAERIATLFWIMTAGSLVVWFAVVGMAVYAVRSRRDAHSRHTANLLVIGGGVALPAVTLAALLAYGMPVLTAVIEPAADDSLRIDVEARQWWWRVRYRDTGAEVETANEIRLPIGRRMTLSLTSRDVIHSFWVPSLAGKMDMFPGRTTQLAIEPTRIGTYRAACAEYCGTSHALMRLVVVVMAEDEFRHWLAQQAQPAIAASGTADFSANGCAACHTIRGSAAAGRIGPDLTHVGSRLSLAGGILPNDADGFARWIARADEIKPETHMPAFRALATEHVRALAAYLESLQ